MIKEMYFLFGMVAGILGLHIELWIGRVLSRKNYQENEDVNSVMRDFNNYLRENEKELPPGFYEALNEAQRKNFSDKPTRL